MSLIWTIKLYEMNGHKHKFRVVITGNDPHLGLDSKCSAEGRTAHEAYERACAKLVVKPWLESKP